MQCEAERGRREEVAAAAEKQAISAEDAVGGVLSLYRQVLKPVTQFEREEALSRLSKKVPELAAKMEDAWPALTPGQSFQCGP